MQSSLLRLAVALLAFGLGVSATMFWIAYSTPDVKRLEAATRHAHPLPLPPLPTVEEPPPPPAPPQRSGRLSGGRLDGKAINKPAPVYPANARAARASGVVHVEIAVDENGKVMSAGAFSGDRLLWAAAEEAAYQAEFRPTRVGGKPYFMTGTLTYNFVLR
jgi:TonB family protein